MGLPPYGMDCCPCLANEEDWRVYPVTPALLEVAGGTPAQAAAPSPERGARAASFLELEQTPGHWAGMVNPNAAANRMASAVMGTPPYGMDCCPCLANEEDYRVYPPS
jgi:hypothetical protein